MKYKYILMCGGTYDKFKTPKQLIEVKGEPLVARTIRLLRENGVTDIAISSNNKVFEQFGVPVLKHNNNFRVTDRVIGYWVDAFYPMNEPVCYLMGDVCFSDNAIKKIVETETDSIEFFASAPPFPKEYTREWAEPFGFKVKNTDYFKECICKTKHLYNMSRFNRHPIAWELWQVIKETELNKIDYTNYTVINDYTCDIDKPDDVEKLEEYV